MSYRLVDANNLADKYPEVNDMPCVYVDLPNGLNGTHYNFTEDTISRKAVIELVENRYILQNITRDGVSEKNHGDICIEDIMELPPAAPTRQKGTWERGYTFPDGEYWKCSKCRELIKVKIPMRFCNNCGEEKERE